MRDAGVITGLAMMAGQPLGDHIYHYWCVHVLYFAISESSASKDIGVKAQKRLIIVFPWENCIMMKSCVGNMIQA